MKASSDRGDIGRRDPDRGLSLFLLALSGAVYFTARAYDDLPSRFPKLLAISLAALALALLAGSLFRKTEEVAARSTSLEALRGPLVVAAGMAAYLALLPRGGYVPTSLALFAFVAKALHYPRLKTLLLAAAVAVLVLYGLFRIALGVPLPPIGWPSS